MRLLKYIVPLLLVFQIAVFAQKFARSETVENCKDIGSNPVIRVCVEEFDMEEHIHIKGLGKKISKFVRSYIKDQKSSDTVEEFVNPRSYGEPEPDPEIPCSSAETWDAICGASCYVIFGQAACDAAGHHY